MSAGEQGVSIRVQPRASRDQIDLRTDGTIAIKLTAPPVEGAANRALTEVNAIQPAPQLSPLGDLFQAAAIGYGGYQNAKNRQAFNQGYYGGNTGGNFYGSGRTYG